MSHNRNRNEERFGHVGRVGPRGLMHYAVNNPQKDPLSLLTFGLLGDGAPADADFTGC
jgi:hypothetical protein